MKKIIVTFVFSIMLAGHSAEQSGFAAGLKAGDSEATMKSVCGEPSGWANLNGSTIWIFDGGEIRTNDGKVTRIIKKTKQAADRQPSKKPPTRQAPKQSIGPKIKIVDFENINRSSTENYVQFVTKVHLKNIGGQGGYWVTELHGLDKDGFPITKQDVNIESYIKAGGELKDSDKMIFTTSEITGVKSWELIVRPRGY